MDIACFLTYYIFPAERERLTRTASKEEERKNWRRHTKNRFQVRARPSYPRSTKSRCNSIVAGVCSLCDQRFPCLHFLYSSFHQIIQGDCCGFSPTTFLSKKTTREILSFALSMRHEHLDHKTRRPAAQERETVIHPPRSIFAAAGENGAATNSLFCWARLHYMHIWFSPHFFAKLIVSFVLEKRMVRSNGVCDNPLKAC
jgi:hypothetical protein